MPKYNVMLPITGYVVVEINAASEKVAIAAALEKDFDIEQIEEWEVHEQVEEGNVSYGSLSRACAELVE